MARALNPLVMKLKSCSNVKSVLIRVLVVVIVPAKAKLADEFVTLETLG